MYIQSNILIKQYGHHHTLIKTLINKDWVIQLFFALVQPSCNIDIMSTLVKVLFFSSAKVLCLCVYIISFGSTSTYLFLFNEPVDFEYEKLRSFAHFFSLHISLILQANFTQETYTEISSINEFSW